MLKKVYGVSLISRTRAFQWFKAFKKDREVMIKLCQSHSKIKVLLTVFFYIRSVIHSEFLSVAQTVNKQYYLIVIIKTFKREYLPKKSSELWQNNS